MSEPISRRALKEALNVQDVPPTYHEKAQRFDLVATAARAILDAPPLDRCDVHQAERFANGEECTVAIAWHNATSRSRPIDPCQFATYVRVKVGP